MSKTLVNHEAHTLTESLGLEENEIREKLNSIVKTFMEDTREKKSIIFEIIAEELSYSELVFCTGNYLIDKIKEANEEEARNKLDTLIKALEGLTGRSKSEKDDGAE